MKDTYYLDPHGNVVLRLADWPIDPDGDLLCWGSAGTDTNTERIETLWYRRDDLAAYRIVTEDEARAAHPAFFAHLAGVDREDR